jgi:penicillin G amidase
MVRAMRRLTFLLATLTVTLAACGDDGGSPEVFDDTIEIDGMSAPASIYVDELGVLHVRCASDQDCVAVQGYFHAAHRFFQMDLRRRLARGRLSELVGDVALPIDRDWRRRMTARDGRPLEEAVLAGASDETRAMVDAYTRGVNAWMADARSGAHGATLSLEYDFLLLLPQKQLALAAAWEPLDTAACALPLVQALTDGSALEIRLGEAAAILDPAVFADLFTQRPASPSTVLEPVAGARSSAAGPTAAQRELAERMRAIAPLLAQARGAGPLPPRGAMGSNNWAVAASRGGGRALLANDPHLTLSHAAIWYMVHLDAVSEGSGTLKVAGMSFAGLPGVVIGQNADIAWGVTTTYFDTADVYVETLTGAGDAVLFDGAPVPLLQVDYQIPVAQKAAEPYRVEVVPHHGPVIARDDQAGTALSLRWTGHDISTDLDFLLALSRATSVAEARGALENVTTLGQNFVVVDRAGSIGWFPYSRLPRRPWASMAVPSWMPVPGDGSAEWESFYRYDELPQLVDPASGYLATANNDMTGALADGDPTDDPWPLQIYADVGFRHQRIVERLEGREQHDLASMQSIQADVLSIPGRLLVPVLLADSAGADLGAGGAAARAALAAWDFTCPSGLATSDPAGPASDDPAERAAAAGCAAFHAVHGRLRTLTFADDLAGVNLDERDGVILLAFLQPDALSGDYFDDIRTADVVETRAEIVAAALEGAGDHLIGKLGPSTDDWMWGRLHTVTLRADLFDQSGVTDYNSGRFAKGGGAYTVDVAHPRNERGDRYEFGHGASVRWACEAGADGVGCTFELPGGQRHLQDSSFFDSLFDEWLQNRPSPMRFELGAVRAAAVERIQAVGR